MNLFYEDLPESVNIDGEEFPVITDFREWIRFFDMLKSDIPPGIKIQFTLDMFLDDRPVLKEGSFEKIITAFNNFLAMADLQPPTEQSEEKIERRSVKKANISYELDAPFIISAFLQIYGIDLLNIEYMHWWKFRILFDGLPENTLIKQRIYYRDVDINSIKDKNEKRRIAKIKRQIALPENKYVSDGEIGNAF